MVNRPGRCAPICGSSFNPIFIQIIDLRDGFHFVKMNNYHEVCATSSKFFDILKKCSIDYITCLIKRSLALVSHLLVSYANNGQLLMQSFVTIGNMSTVMLC